MHRNDDNQRRGHGAARSKGHARRTRAPVALPLDPSHVRQDTGVRRQASKCHADVVVDAHNLLHDPRVLELGRALLLNAKHHDVLRGRTARSHACEHSHPKAVCLGARRAAVESRLAFPLSPTASVPFFTASRAYSTWNLQPADTLGLPEPGTAHAGRFEGRDLERAILVRPSRARPHKWPSGEKTVMARSYRAMVPV